MNGLVLEGGGIKGAYQIGAYYAFKKCNIKFSYIVGTSIGAFNGAVIAAGNEKKLLEFWQNIDPGLLLNFDGNFVKSVNDGHFSLDGVKGLGLTVFKILQNKGIDTYKLKETAKMLINENELRHSKTKFGLATLKFKKLTPTYMFIDDIKEGKLIDSIMASCYLPIFKMEKIIDDSYYLDGGFFDNCPTTMLLDKNLDCIYEVKIRGIGISKKYQKRDNNIITIKPSRSLGSVLELKSKKINDNILMGYYDTLRVLKGYDGYKFCFKNYGDWFYNRLIKGIDKREVKRIKLFMNVNSNRDVIIKSIENIMVKEKFNYYDIYSVTGVIRKIKKIKKNDFIYNFVRKLSFW